jgi:hypothetical protein
VLERVSRAEGPWQCIAADLEDSVVADVAAYEGGRDPAPVVLFIDKTAPAETLLFYRINAVNATGETVSSNVVEFMRHWVRRHLFVLHVTLAQADGTVSID